MGSIIAVHRKVAPAPVIESKYGVLEDVDVQNAADKHYHEDDDASLEFVLCTQNVATLGITTLSVLAQDNLLHTRFRVEALAKREPSLLQNGRFLFLMPDGIACQRGWESDVLTFDAGWSNTGGKRLVVVSDRPPKAMQQNDDSKEAEQNLKRVTVLPEDVSTPSSPPSLMARPLLTPSGSNTHTLTGGGSELLQALKEEESVLRHQEAIQRMLREEQENKLIDEKKNDNNTNELANPLLIELLVHSLGQLLTPIDASKEIEWRAASFHEGTRQWYMDRFDAWCRLSSEGAEGHENPTVGILQAPAGSGKTCLACRLRQLHPQDVVALHLCKHDDISTLVPKRILRTLSYQLACASSRMLLRVDEGESGGDFGWPTMGQYLQALGREVSSLRRCDLDSDGFSIKEIFSRLIATPLLSTSAPTDGRRRVLMIDGIDLCPELLDSMLECAEMLPAWVGMFFTTRTGCKSLDTALSQPPSPHHHQTEEKKMNEEEGDDKEQEIVSMLGFEPELNAMDVRVVLRHALRNSPMYARAGGESVATTSTVLTRAAEARVKMKLEIEMETTTERRKMADSSEEEQGNETELDMGGGSSMIEATDALLDEAVAILWSKSEDSMLVCSFMVEKIHRPSTLVETESNTVTNASIWKEETSNGMSTGTMWLRELTTYPSSISEWYNLTLMELLALDEMERAPTIYEKEDSTCPTSSTPPLPITTPSISSTLPNPTPTLRCLRLLAVAREPLHVQAVEKMLGCTTLVRRQVSARLSHLFPIRQRRMHSVHRGFTDWLTEEEVTEDRAVDQAIEDEKDEDKTHPWKWRLGKEELERDMTTLCLHLLETATETSLIEMCAEHALEQLRREKEKKEKEEKQKEMAHQKKLDRKKDTLNGIDWRKRERSEKEAAAAARKAGGTVANRTEDDDEDDDEEIPLVWRNEAHFYALRHLHPCLMLQGRVQEARSLALTFKWMLARAVEGPVFSVLEALESVLRVQGVRSSKMSARVVKGAIDGTTDESVELVASALRLSLASIYSDPWQLPSQLVGRLLGHAAAAEEIALLLHGARSWSGRLPRKLCPEHAKVSEKEPRKMTAVGEGLEGGWWCPVAPSLETPGGPLLCVLSGHEGGVESVSWCPGDDEGNTIVSVGRSGQVRLWNLDAGPTSRLLEGGHTLFDHEEQRIEHNSSGKRKLLRATCFSPDGKWIATAGEDNRVCLWSAKSGQCVNQLVGHSESVVDVRWSANGKTILTGSSDWMVRLWWPETDETKTQRESEDIGGKRGEEEKEEDNKKSNRIKENNDHLDQWSDEEEYEETEEEAREDLVYQIAEAKREYRAQVALNVSFAMQAAYKASWKDLVEQERNLSSVYEAKHEAAAQKSREEEERMEQEKLSKLAATKDTNAMSKIPWGNADIFEHVQMDGHEWRVTNCCFLSTDGEVVASSGDDETLRIYDVNIKTRTFNVRHVLWGHSGTVRVCQGSPDGETLVSGGGDHDVRVWDVMSGTCLNTLTRHDGIIMALQYDQDGARLLSSGWDNLVCVWDTKKWEIIVAVPTGMGGEDSPTLSLVWAPGAEPDRLITGGLDSTLKCWDVPVLLREEKERQRLKRSSSNKAVSKENSGIIDDESASKQSITDVKWSPDGTRICTTSKDWSSRIWSSSNGRCLYVLRKHKGTALTIGARTEDGTPFLTAVPDSRWVWNSETEEFDREMEGHRGAVSVCEWSHDGTRVATASVDGTVRLWNAATGKCLHILRGHRSWIGCLCFSPDGSGIVSGSADRTLRIFLTNTPLGIVSDTDHQDDSVCCLKGHLGMITDVHWCPVGRARVASSSTDWSVRVWDLESAKCIHVLDGHGGTVSSVCWSFDGRRVGSGSADQTVRVWRIYTRRYDCTDVLKGHGAGVETVSWSSNGKMMLSGGVVEDVQERSVIVWNTLTRKEKEKEMEVKQEVENVKAKAKTDVVVDGRIEIVNGGTCTFLGTSERENDSIVDVGTSLSLKHRADFVHVGNRAPTEHIGASDPTIGFSASTTTKTKTGLRVCPANPRRAYAISEDWKKIHLLERVGGSGMCVDCMY